MTPIVHTFKKIKFESTRSDRSVCIVYTRSICSMVGVVSVWKGLWNICDLYIWTSNAWRETIYVVAGLILLIATRTLFTNAGVIINVDNGTTNAGRQQNTTSKDHTLSILELIGTRGMGRNIGARGIIGENTSKAEHGSNQQPG